MKLFPPLCKGRSGGVEPTTGALFYHSLYLPSPLLTKEGNLRMTPSPLEGEGWGEGAVKRAWATNTR